MTLTPAHDPAGSRPAGGPGVTGPAHGPIIPPVPPVPVVQTVPVPVPVVEIVPPVPLVPVVPPPSDGRPAPQPSYDPVLPRAVCEFALTALLLFLIVSSVRWLVGPDPAAPVAHPAVLGCVVGTVLVLLLTSPPGRRSGGHLNPAVTLALWRLGAFPGRDVVPYAVGQLAGSVLGAWLGGLVWGPAAVLPPVRHSSVRADPAWGGAAVLAAEAGVLAGFTLLLAVLLGSPGGRRLLPYAVGLVVALVVAVLGPLSGGSANPARQFGPALLAGDAGRLWVYLLGPALGAVLGAWPAGWVGLRRYR